MLGALLFYIEALLFLLGYIFIKFGEVEEENRKAEIYGADYYAISYLEHKHRERMKAVDSGLTYRKH